MATLFIESVNHQGQGIAHDNGKVVFIEGALPLETVRCLPVRHKKNYNTAQMTEIVQPSSQRIQPRCEYFGVCGGCLFQHAEPFAQVAIKQRILEDNLWHIGKVRAEQILPALHGPSWGYRHRARLSVRWVEKKNSMLIGFREKNSRYVADMAHCAVLPVFISALLLPLRALIGQLSIRSRAPQIEVAVGEPTTALVLRVMEVLTDADERLLYAFIDRYSTTEQPLQWWLQPRGPETATPFYPMSAPPLAYHLPEFDLQLPFRPTEFTQVNPAMNRSLVSRALQLLDVKPGERVADAFCGLGNFTLPIARRGATAVGLEGSATLCARATANAAHNGLSEKTEFLQVDLFKITEESFAQLGPFNRLLIDPPRDGAIALIKALGTNRPQKIVYVSCNPSTLARDAGLLVHLHGYRLKAAGIINMFPQTAHVESIACFERYS